MLTRTYITSHTNTRHNTRIQKQKPTSLFETNQTYIGYCYTMHIYNFLRANARFVAVITAILIFRSFQEYDRKTFIFPISELR